MLHRVERMEKKFGIDALTNSFYSEVNYYEFVLNEENITRFIESETEE